MGEKRMKAEKMTKRRKRDKRAGGGSRKRRLGGNVLMWMTALSHQGQLLQVCVGF